MEVTVINPSSYHYPSRGKPSNAPFAYQKNAETVEEPKGLGRLKSLGVTDDYLLPFLLPRKYIDLRSHCLIDTFSALPDRMNDKVYIVCQLIDTPTVQRDESNNKPSMTRFRVKDKHNNSLRLVYFGPSTEFVKNLMSNPTLCLSGVVSEWEGQLQLKNIDWIAPQWVGRTMPVYAGKTKVISPETVRDRVIGLLEPSLDLAVDYLRKRFNVKNDVDDIQLVDSLGGNGRVKLRDLLKAAHKPPSPEIAGFAQLLLQRLAAREVVEKLNQFSLSVNPESSLRISGAVVKSVIQALPANLSLTRDQVTAIKDIIDDLRSNTPMRRLLTGDVGTGKSLPIAIAAAVVAKIGGNAVILMPNEPLAEQMRHDIEQWWPDIEPKLVANSTSKKALPVSRVLVGTTALNFRVPSDYRVDLLLIDEQQKMSVNQRLHLAGPHTNVLEASATPLPRSLALIKFGGMPISTLHQAYTTKTINTAIIHNDLDSRRQLFQQVKTTISAGYQVLIIYPLAEEAEIDDEAADAVNLKNDRKSAEGAFALWDKHYPGRVRFAHGKQKSDEKIANIGALNKGEAEILCSTTVVEVGLNVPRLRLCVIVHPERLGLATLHQIRGRLCRHGGEGQCLLYLPKAPSEKSMRRLQVFEKLNDGFQLAVEDMKLRGMGDMVSASQNEQSGDVSVSFLVKQRLSVEVFDWASKRYGMSGETQVVGQAQS